MKKYLVVFSIIFCILFMTGCGKKSPENNTNNNENKEAVPVKKVKVVDLESNTRPIAVMINNLNDARPYQSGLQDAYIVYEIIVEGGVTRMLAVFKDADTARLGPVRSSRHYYLDYALENDAIYVHYGWSPQAKSDIRTLGINNINGLYDDSPFTREDLPVAWEHRVFTSMERLVANAKKKNYRMTSDAKTLLNYSVDEVTIDDEEAIDANEISIKYSYYTTTGYKYNPDDKLYYRSVNGKEHVDYVSKKQFTAKNIIIAYAANSYIANDNKGRQDLNNLGTGSGYYITDGKAVPITWEKKTRKDQTVYKYKDGKEITVNDGNTFIQIAPPKSATIS